MLNLFGGNIDQTHFHIKLFQFKVLENFGRCLQASLMHCIIPAISMLYLYFYVIFLFLCYVKAGILFLLKYYICCSMTLARYVFYFLYCQVGACFDVLFILMLLHISFFKIVNLYLCYSVCSLHCVPWYQAYFLTYNHILAIMHIFIQHYINFESFSKHSFSL